jgi:hypothetical protein
MVTGIPPSFLPPFGADPFSMLATNPNFLTLPPYGAQYAHGYLQVCESLREHVPDGLSLYH